MRACGRGRGRVGVFMRECVYKWELMGNAEGWMWVGGHLVYLSHVPHSLYIFHNLGTSMPDDKEFHFHLSPRLCPSNAGCSPPSVPSIVLCLLLSCSLLPRYVVLLSSASSSPQSLPSPWLPLCAAFGPPIVLHSCYMSGPSPLLFHSVYSIIIIELN